MVYFHIKVNEKEAVIQVCVMIMSNTTIFRSL